MENRCAFWQNRKTALPQQHSVATCKSVLWGKAVFSFLPKLPIYTIWRGTWKFPKRQRHFPNFSRVGSLHSVPLAIRLISKPTPRTFQVHTKQNQRIISCFPAWDRMREDWKQKRKQAPEPDGGGACVWILNLSLCSSVNALYHSNIEKNISQYVTINCNFYKCTFKLKALDNTARLNVCYM